jgi:colicin import membrane protein
MELKKEDFKLFKTYEGRQFYALPAKFFNQTIPPVADPLELIAAKEAEELMNKKQLEKEKKAAAIAEKKRLAEEKRIAEEKLKIELEAEARRKAAEELKIAQEEEKKKRDEAIAGKKAELEALKAQKLAELRALETSDPEEMIDEE